MSLVEKTIGSIQPVNVHIGQQVARYIDTLTKPPGSLGRLESLAVQLAEITGEQFPTPVPPGIIIMAADHGVAAEGVSAFPQQVTEQMVLNFLAGGAAINVFGKQIGATLDIVDIGIAGDVCGEGLIRRKIRRGTGNIAREPAMTKSEAEESIQVGIEIAEKQIKQGVNCLIPGEMGIANTTSSSAVVAACCRVEAETGIQALVGSGTGIDEQTRTHKQAIVSRTLALHTPNADDPIEVLMKVGGLEIGGLVGVILGAATHRKPVLVDGWNSTAAALLATKMSPTINDYLVVSHLSEECGHRHVLETMAKKPLLDLQLRLGEGSGAALAFPLLDAACRMVADMATFESANVSTKMK